MFDTIPFVVCTHEAGIHEVWISDKEKIVSHDQHKSNQRDLVAEVIKKKTYRKIH